MHLWMAGSALFSLLYLVSCVGRAHPPRLAPAIKTVPVAILAVAGIVSGVPVTIWAGLVLGALGDFLLALAGRRAFLAGMAAFAAGHLAYAWGFGLHWPGFAVAVALLVLALSTEVWLIPQTGDLAWPVRGYVLVICLMLAMALAQPAGILRIGALLFVLSDLLLAMQLFRVTGPGTRAVLPLAVWPAYWTGQALILLSFAPAA